MDSTPPPANGQNPASPAFSGGAPMMNPFSSQNTIPSSANGDIVVSSDGIKSKKGLIIALVAIGILVIGAIIAAIILSSQLGNQNNSTDTTREGTTKVTASELKSSFDALANILVSGNASSSGPVNFSTPLEEWQITKMNKGNTTNSVKTTYANAILESNNSFRQMLEDYMSTYTSDNQEELNNLVSIYAIEADLNAKNISSALYFREDQFIETLAADINKPSEELEKLISEELAIGDNISSDKNSVHIIDDLRKLYKEAIPQLTILNELGCLDNVGKPKNICNNGTLESQYVNNQELNDSANNISELLKDLRVYFNANVSQLHDLLVNHLNPAMEKIE